MFDLFSATPEQLNEVSKHFTIQFVALSMLLIGKGIITQDELNEAITRATGLVDQEWQRKLDEQRAELEKKHPGLAFIEKMFGTPEDWPSRSKPCA